MSKTEYILRQKSVGDEKIPSEHTAYEVRRYTVNGSYIRDSMDGGPLSVHYECEDNSVTLRIYSIVCKSELPDRVKRSKIMEPSNDNTPIWAYDFQVYCNDEQIIDKESMYFSALRVKHLCEILPLVLYWRDKDEYAKLKQLPWVDENKITVGEIIEQYDSRLQYLGGTDSEVSKLEQIRLDMYDSNVSDREFARRSTEFDNGNILKVCPGRIQHTVKLDSQSETELIYTGQSLVEAVKKYNEERIERTNQGHTNVDN